MVTPLQALLIEIKDAIKCRDYFTIEVKVGDQVNPEYITNSWDNLFDKSIYYASAYDDELHLKANPNIRISDYYCGLPMVGYDKYI